MKTNICGIDISQKTFDCYFLTNVSKDYYTFPQNNNGYSDFLLLVKSLDIDVVGFESTGRYHKNLEGFLKFHNINYLVLHPTSVSLFIKSTMIKGKTDKSDSRGIALYIQANPELITYPTPIRDKYKPMTSAIVLYDKQLRQLKNYHHSIASVECDEALLLSIVSNIDYLKKAKKDLLKHTVQSLYSDIECAKIINSEIVGVGDNLLLHLLPLIYDNFDKFTIKQMTSFLGIAPVSFQSGTSVKRHSHISAHGDNNFRKVLFMATMSATLHNPVIRSKYQTMVSNGKPKKVAYVACMSHLLRAIVSRLSHHTGRSVKK